MSRPSAQQLDQLYKQTLAASKRFASYNFREYFVRRTNERFTPLLSSSDTSGNVDASVNQKWWEKRVQELDVLKRAGEVNRTFQGPKMVIEHARPITGESIWSFPNRWSLRSVLMILLFFFDDLLVYSRWWRGRRSQSLVPRALPGPSPFYPSHRFISISHTPLPSTLSQAEPQTRRYGITTATVLSPPFAWHVQNRNLPTSGDA